MDEITKVTHIDNVKLTDNGKTVTIIDQTQLPNRMVYLTMDKEEDCYDAILKLKVRGAPAIGIFAGYAMYVLCQKYAEKPYAEFAAEFHRQKEYLNSSRPTAVNLSWALNRMENGGTAYRRQAGNFGGYQFGGSPCGNLCLCYLAQLLCCGGRVPFLFCC